MPNFFSNAASNVFFKIRRNIFGLGVPKPPPTPPSAPPVVGNIPRFTTPPTSAIDPSRRSELLYGAGKEQPGVIYKAPDKKTQFEQWQEQERQAGYQDTGVSGQQESENQISFIPVSRGRLAPRPIGKTPTAAETQESAQSSARDHILLIAARPKTFINLFLDELQKLGAEIPILKLIINKPRSQEEMIAQAIERYISENPEKADSQEIRDLKANTSGVSQEVITTTGQVKSLRFIPEEKIDTERQRPIYQQSQESYLPMQISPGRLIRFLPSDTFERLITQRFGQGFSRAATTLGQNVLSRGAIVGRGLIGGALRGLGGQAVRFVAGMGARMAAMAAVGTSWAWLPWVIGGALILIVVVGGIFLLTGPMNTRQAAFVGGGPGDSQPSGNKYIDIQISSSKASIPNNGLPTDVTFAVTVKPKLEAFVGSPSIQVRVNTSGKGGSKTLASETWSDETKALKVDLAQGLEDTIVSLSVIVSVGVQGQSEKQTGAATSVVRIGNPVTACPSGWPTKGYVSQGPDGTFSHKGSEAIDVEGVEDRPIYASLDGTAVPLVDQYGGKYIRITTNCDGKQIHVDFVHFHNYAISGPTPVKAGDLLGYMGHTGYAYTDHLHYQFYGIQMQPPYIPLPIERKCVGKDVCGNIEF